MKEKYKVYLRSPKWKKLREKVLERDEHQCRTCASSDELHVCHRTFERIYHEKLSDLITLCRPCHDAIKCAVERRKNTEVKIELKNYVRTTPRYIPPAHEEKLPLR